MSGNTLFKEPATTEICDLWIVQHQGGIMLADRKGNRWIGGSPNSILVAIFYTKEEAQQAARRARKQRPELYGWLKVRRCCAVKKAAEKAEEARE